MDLHNNIKQVRLVGPVAIGANATVSGKVIDRKGYAGVEFILSYGAIATTGTVVTPVVKEGDATGSMTSVADADLIGTEALAARLGGATTSGVGANVSKRVGYRGNKRYVTVDMVKSGTTSVGCMGVTALLFNPANAPVSNP
jgi:hypothetical protein